MKTENGVLQPQPRKRQGVPGTKVAQMENKFFLEGIEP